jgi:superfamily I DNA and/or RNA helicase
LDRTIKNLDQLRQLIRLEQDEERQWFANRMDGMSMRQRIEQGLTWYPLSIADWYFDAREKLVMEVERVKDQHLPHEFNVGRLVALFGQQSNPPQRTTGVVMAVRGNMLKLSLHADDMEEWMKAGKLGLDVLHDEKSYQEMDRVLRSLKKTENRQLQRLLQVVYGQEKAKKGDAPTLAPNQLNPAQNQALANCLAQEELAIVHGPPGTGKTTTVVEVVKHLVATGQKILVTAPSNNAVDLLVEKLAERDIRVLRVGNPARINEVIQTHSLGHRVTQHPDYGLIKKLKQQSAQYRNMASKYRRQYGPEERQQRKALFDEAWKLQKDAQQIEDYIIESMVSDAQVIATTLVGCTHPAIAHLRFPVCVVDEAAQALAPATWIPMVRADKTILAGDHCQLPPTVKSLQAQQQGLAHSLFEHLMDTQDISVMLETQYRMNLGIMGFPSTYFYHNRLEAHSMVAHRKLEAEGPEFEFIDTAGCSFDEDGGETGQGNTGSLSNHHEADLVWKHLYMLAESLTAQGIGLNRYSCAIISPYKAQVNKLMEWLGEFPFPKDRLAINTIDGFQGQERDIVYISLVRSNGRNEIGFLKDYRRMNVAMTRARRKLVVVGDSATLAKDPFYAKMITHVEELGGYCSAWEYLYPH